MIAVRKTAEGDPATYEIVVSDSKGESRHAVTVSAGDQNRLAPGGQSGEKLLEAAFLFLLDRESKESILGRFDITVISRYFPEFEREVGGYLAKV